MKLSDIFYKQNQIIINTEQLFIAESDFNYSGLDIKLIIKINTIKD